MSLLEALKGARIELAAIPGPAAKLHRLVGITRTFAVEIVQQLLLAPYAFRALRTYHGLPRLENSCYQRPDGVSIMKDLSYGRKTRNVVDVYVPPGTPVGLGSEVKGGTPVALFCHGGVWAAGDKWQYSPMATRLAGAGVLTVVMHYSLFPGALVPEMVDEVSAALSWTLDHCATLGGDPARVSLVGHSAGSQLAMMALLHRAKRGGLQNGRKQEATKSGIPSLLPSTDAWQQDGRMPKRFVGMAGVYDLTKHFSYETQRSVHELSTMQRAAGGAHRFPSVSPAVIVARALREAEPNDGKIKSIRGSTESGSGKADRRQALRGEALAHRIGFERPRASQAERLAAVLGPDAGGIATNGSAANGGTADGSMANGGAPDALRLSVGEARRLPPTVLMSSCADKVVPWYESAEMFWMLHDCGVPVKHLVEPFAAHADYVISWRPRPSSKGADMGEDLPDVAREMLLIVSEQVEPQWV